MQRGNDRVFLESIPFKINLNDVIQHVKPVTCFRRSPSPFTLGFRFTETQVPRNAEPSPV